MNKLLPILIAIAALAAIVIFIATRSRSKSGGASNGSGKITFEDPSNILFSLPTICDLAPPVENIADGQSSTGSAIHEDDWRQIEFVSATDAEYLRKLAAEVAQFAQSNRVDSSGWKNIFVRKEHPHPLNTLQLRYSDLEKIFPEAKTAVVLRLTSGSGSVQVKGGFIFEVKGLGHIFGRRQDDLIGDLCLTPKFDAPNESVNLKAYCVAHGLLIADWYRRELIDLQDSNSSQSWISSWTQK